MITLFAGEAADQVFAGALPGCAGRHLDSREAGTQMAAPVEIVESDHRQISRYGKAAALGFEQHAIGDHVVAANDGGGALVTG